LKAEWLRELLKELERSEVKKELERLEVKKELSSVMK